MVQNANMDCAHTTCNSPETAMATPGVISPLNRYLNPRYNHLRMLKSTIQGGFLVGAEIVELALYLLAILACLM